MALGLFELFLVAVALGTVGLVVSALLSVTRRASAGPGPSPLPARQRAELAEAVARAHWAPAHDEVDGVTRVLLRRSYPGADGLPVVLEDRVYTTFPAADPAWEARFTEAMSGARFRCSYLNAEESAG